MRDEIYTISIVRPDGCNVTRMRYYIKAAVECWSGQFEPDDPLFGHFHKRGNAVHVARKGPWRPRRKRRV